MDPRRIDKTALQSLASLGSIAFVVVAALLVGIGGGYLLDQWLGSEPLFVLLGGFLGLVGAAVQSWRILKPFIGEDRAEDSSKDL